MDIDKEVDNRRHFLTDQHQKSDSHLHLNAVAIQNDEIYVLFNAYGAICNLSRGEVVIQDDALIRGHNLIFLDDGVVVVNDTFGRTIRIYDLNRKELLKVIDLTAFEWVQNLERAATRRNVPRKLFRAIGLSRKSISRPLFVRGLDRRGDHLYIGLSPASILCVNWQTGELEETYQYSDDPRVCIHGLALLP
jgi:hypothetical protein